MKIFIVCSKSFYNKIPKIKSELENMGHEIVLPNCYDNPESENEYRAMGKKEHQQFKKSMIKCSEQKISNIDAVLVLNYNKKGIKNYIGGATFLEMYDTFRLNKQIYLYNEIPKGILEDEILGFEPIIINGNLNEIKKFTYCE
jgi:hypothetical protein